MSIRWYWKAGFPSLAAASIALTLVDLGFMVLRSRWQVEERQSKVPPALLKNLPAASLYCLRLAGSVGAGVLLRDWRRAGVGRPGFQVGPSLNGCVG